MNQLFETDGHQLPEHSAGPSSREHYRHHTGPQPPEVCSQLVTISDRCRRLDDKPEAKIPNCCLLAVFAEHRCSQMLLDWCQVSTRDHLTDVMEHAGEPRAEGLWRADAGENCMDQRLGRIEAMF